MRFAEGVDERIRVASPARGRSIAGQVGKSIGELHRAVTVLAKLAEERDYVPRWLEQGASRDEIPAANRFERAAWAIVAIALCEMQTHKGPASIERSLRWFGSEVPSFGFEEAEEALSGIRAKSPEFASLYPYLMDTFGRTSRLDVIRDDSLKESRRARKEIGSFYTPADVAFFMASSIAQSFAPSSSDARVWFDPACGSGVFLIAALRAELLRNPSIDAKAFAETNLLGTDISPQACDFAAFAIVNELANCKVALPLQLWLSVRDNIIAVDALKFAQAGRAAFENSFPRAKGSMRLLCNPPYVNSASEKIGSHGTRSLYLPFIEMMWKVASGPNDASAIITPLALASNISKDHQRCRTELAANGGAWTLLFFDRQPHAIFGEDAKTRATIAIRRPGPQPADLYTSSLLKWTSRQRPSILSESRRVHLGHMAITRLIPKLGSDDEVGLYNALLEYRLRSPFRPNVTKAAPNEIVGDALSTDVFIGGTAYNFLNVFRNYPDHLSWRGELSASGIHKLSFKDKDRADAATALLTSRVCFWLWHVECDGFHVPAWFVADTPLLDLNFSESQQAELSSLGRLAWLGLQDDMVTSLNRDKVTFAFRPGTISDIRTRADQLILDAIGINSALAEALQEFEHRVVSIDGTKRKAAHPKLVNLQPRGTYAPVN